MAQQGSGEEGATTAKDDGRSAACSAVSKLDKRRSYFYLIFSIIGAIALFAGLCWALGKISLAMYTLLLMLFLVFILHRFVDMLERHHVQRGWSIIIGYIIIVGVIVGIIAAFSPVIVTQITDFVKALPGYVDRIKDWYDQLAGTDGPLNNANIQSWLASFSSSLSDWTASLAKQIASGALSVGMSIGESFVVILMAAVAAFWLLLDYHRIGREFSVMVGPKYAGDCHDVMSICGHCLGGYIKGVLIASVFTGTIAGIGFALLGLPYAAVLGLLTGIMNIIPIIGPWTAGIVAAIIGIFVSPFACIMSILITILAQQFTDAFITPRVMQSTAEIHPALTIVALMAGGAVGGALGMIIAVPLLATVKAVYAYYFEKRTGRQLVSRDGAFFKGDPADVETSDALHHSGDADVDTVAGAGIDRDNGRKPTRGVAKHASHDAGSGTRGDADAH